MHNRQYGKRENNPTHYLHQKDPLVLDPIQKACDGEVPHGVQKGQREGPKLSCAALKQALNRHDGEEQQSPEDLSL